MCKHRASCISVAETGKPVKLPGFIRLGDKAHLMEKVAVAAKWQEPGRGAWAVPGRVPGAEHALGDGQGLRRRVASESIDSQVILTGALCSAERIVPSEFNTVWLSCPVRHG